jgi:hypothetical protein
MRQYWRPKFIHFSENLASEIMAALYVLLGTEGFMGVRTVLLCGLFAMGVVTIRKEFGIQKLIVVLAPFILVIIAAAAQQYPIESRLVLFAAPLLFIVYAAGLVGIADIAGKRSRVACAVLSSVVIIPTMYASVRYVQHFPKRETTRQALSCMTSVDRGAPVYIAFRSYRQWAYYAQDWSMAPATIKDRIEAIESCRNCEFSFAGQRKEIVGVAWRMDKADSWVDREVDRIASVDNAVWLFLALYGYEFRADRPLEKLQEKLEARGFSRTNSCSEGETTALRYQAQLTASAP